jgi:hypothetical protein
VLGGYAGASVRIGIAPDGIAITTPGWRACPWPPVRQYRLDWAEVRAVRHRTELYRLGPLPWRLPLESYAIEAAESIVFGSYYLADLEPVLIDLANRADCPWYEDGEVEANLLGTLLVGAPNWPTVAGQPPPSTLKACESAPGRAPLFSGGIDARDPRTGAPEVRRSPWRTGTRP